MSFVSARASATCCFEAAPPAPPPPPALPAPLLAAEDDGAARALAPADDFELGCDAPELRALLMRSAASPCVRFSHSATRVSHWTDWFLRASGAKRSQRMCEDVGGHMEWRTRGSP